MIVAYLASLLAVNAGLLVYAVKRYNSREKRWLAIVAIASFDIVVILDMLLR